MSKRYLCIAGVLMLVPTLGLAAGPANFDCLPKPQWPLNAVHGDLPAGVSLDKDSYMAFVCELANGYQVNAFLDTKTSAGPLAVQYAEGTYSLAAAQANYAKSYVAPTASEQAFLDTIINQVKPIGLVSYNGKAVTRSVYTLNMDGTLNATAVVGESVAVGDTCDTGSRIPTTKNYFSVAGRTNKSAGAPANSVLPPQTFAVCTIVLPHGSTLVSTP